MSALKDSAVVEELRLLGNTFFKAGQYRRAEKVYKNGLAHMDRSLDNVCITGPPFHVHMNSTRAAMPLSPRDNLTAATLLVNLAQALLSGSTSVDAAREAFYIIACAESHLAFVIFWNRTEASRASTQEVQWLEQQYANLMEKAFMRKGMALERCADPAGALAAYSRCNSSHAKERGDAMMAILQSFHSRRNESFMPVPEALRDCLLEHAHWKYRTTLSPWEAVAACPERWGHDLGPMEAAFSCGFFQEVHTLVMVRFKSRDRSGDLDVYTYYLWRLRPDGKTVNVFPLEVETQSRFDTGAMLNQKLYCPSLCESPPVMQVWYMRSTGGRERSVKLPIKEVPTGRDLQLRRTSAGLVECCGNLYMFGGLALGTSIETAEAKCDVLKFVHTHDRFVECSLYCLPDVREEVSCPAPRFGHATFVHGHYIYIFGGTEGPDPSNPLMPDTPLTYMDDLWCFDIHTKEWRQLEPLGVRPSPRAFMGVGWNVKHTVIMGGETLQLGFDKTFNLADMWEFDPAACTWTPIITSPKDSRCLTSRRCPGVALNTDDDVFLFGGHSDWRNRRAGVVDCVHLAICRFVAVDNGKFRQRLRPPKGAWRDVAVEDFCRGRAQKQFRFGMLEKETLLMSAPAGSVLMLTPRPAELAACALTPADAANPSFRHLLPFPYTFMTGKLEPFGIIEGDDRLLFFSGGSPFDAAPRWMTPPSEITTKLLASSDDPVSLPDQGGCFDAWHSVKQFSTVKAAALFFRMHQPHIGWGRPSLGWGRVKDLPLYKDTQRLKEWDLRELSVFYTTRQCTGRDKHLRMAQYYILMVFGRVFVCLLTTVLNALPEFLPRIVEMAESLIWMQHKLLTQPSVSLRPACQYCGTSDPAPTTVEKYPPEITMKVCKGCRLVRYCGRKCQQADWRKHQIVCTRVAARQELELWTNEHIQ